MLSCMLCVERMLPCAGLGRAAVVGLLLAALAPCGTAAPAQPAAVAPSQAAASSTPIAAAMATGVVPERPSLGTLLLTPAERAQLPARRAALAGDPSARTPDDDEASQPPPARASEAGPPAAPAEPRTVNGWVVRGAGRSTVWINGQPVYDFERDGPARRALLAQGLIGPGRAAGADTPGGLRVRPGQTVESGIDAPRDLLPPGSLRVGRGDTAVHGPASTASPPRSVATPAR